MQSLDSNYLVQQGIVANRMGQPLDARRYFEAAVKSDDKNVAAWWWLAQTEGDAKTKRKLLEHTRAVAVLSTQNLATYRDLLHKAGADILRPYRLDGHSRSVSDKCPIDTVPLQVGDTIVICPICSRAHHLDCWEANAFHCGNFACDGSGLLDRNAAASIEPAAVHDTVVVQEQEIPAESPWKSTEEREAGFVNQLQERAARFMAATVARQIRIEEQARYARARAQQEYEDQRRQEALDQQRQIVERSGCALLAGLIPGIILAIAVQRYTGDWLLALFAIYLVATSIATTTAHAMQESGRFVSVIYWLLPRLTAAVIAWLSFQQSQNGFLAVVFGSVGGIVLEQILSIRAIHARRAFLVYSLLAVAALLFLRSRATS